MPRFTSEAVFLSSGLSTTDAPCRAAATEGDEFEGAFQRGVRPPGATIDDVNIPNLRTYRDKEATDARSFHIDITPLLLECILQNIGVTAEIAADVVDAARGLGSHFRSSMRAPSPTSPEPPAPPPVVTEEARPGPFIFESFDDFLVPSFGDGVTRSVSRSRSTSPLLGSDAISSLSEEPLPSPGGSPGPGDSWPEVSQRDTKSSHMAMDTGDGAEPSKSSSSSDAFASNASDSHGSVTAEPTRTDTDQTENPVLSPSPKPSVNNAERSSPISMDKSDNVAAAERVEDQAPSAAPLSSDSNKNSRANSADESSPAEVVPTESPDDDRDFPDLLSDGDADMDVGESQESETPVVEDDGEIGEYSQNFAALKHLIEGDEKKRSEKAADKPGPSKRKRTESPAKKDSKKKHRKVERLRIPPSTETKSPERVPVTPCEEGEIDHVSAKGIQGTVKWFSVRNGYGFITRIDTGKDVFVHQTATVRGRPDTLLWALREGEPVLFDVIDGQKGLQAANVGAVVGATGQGGGYASDRKGDESRNRPRSPAQKDRSRKSRKRSSKSTSRDRRSRSPKSSHVDTRRESNSPAGHIAKDQRQTSWHESKKANKPSPKSTSRDRRSPSPSDVYRRRQSNSPAGRLEKNGSRHSSRDRMEPKKRSSQSTSRDRRSPSPLLSDQEKRDRVHHLSQKIAGNRSLSPAARTASPGIAENEKEPRTPSVSPELGAGVEVSIPARRSESRLTSIPTEEPDLPVDSRAKDAAPVEPRLHPFREFFQKGFEAKKSGIKLYMSPQLRVALFEPVLGPSGNDYDDYFANQAARVSKSTRQNRGLVYPERDPTVGRFKNRVPFKGYGEDDSKMLAQQDSLARANRHTGRYQKDAQSSPWMNRRMNTGRLDLRGYELASKRRCESFRGGDLETVANNFKDIVFSGTRSQYGDQNWRKSDLVNGIGSIRHTSLPTNRLADWVTDRHLSRPLSAPSMNNMWQYFNTDDPRGQPYSDNGFNLFFQPLTSLATSQHVDVISKYCFLVPSALPIELQPLVREYQSSTMTQYNNPQNNRRNIYQGPGTQDTFPAYGSPQGRRSNDHSPSTQF